MGKSLTNKSYDPIPGDIAHDALMLTTFFTGIHVGAHLYKSAGEGRDAIMDILYGPKTTTTNPDGTTKETRDGGILSPDGGDGGSVGRSNIDEILTATSPLYVAVRYGVDIEKILTVTSPAYAIYKAARKRRGKK